MNEKQILEFCLTHNITVKQFFIVYTTAQRWKGYGYQAKEFAKAEPWSESEVQDLINKGILESFDGGLTYVSLKVNPEFFITGIQNTEMGEELWNAYPATFPLTGGGNFNARTTKGMGKEALIADYLRRIGNDPEKHKFVLEQLKRYTRIVLAGKINGHSIVEFIRDEVWDSIDYQVETDMKSKFGTDI